MLNLIKPILFLCFLFYLSGCSDSRSDKADTSSDSSSLQDEHPTPKIRGISGEEIFIHTGPDESFPRLVNEKASASMGKTDYCALDHSVKVVVLEINGAWSKINVVDPDWLTATYLGWIPSKYILNGLAEEEPVAKLDSREYEIIKTKHNSTVQNYAVLLKRKKFDKKSLHEFIRSFRQKICTGNCNVNVYDSRAVLPYLDEYPLSRKHYLIVADHYLAMSTFDVPEASDWYPYQDFQYSEYGGRHWKKKPIR